MKHHLYYNIHIHKILQILYITMENKVWIYRTKHNMSLRDLSRKTGISLANLNKIENNNTHDILLSNAVALSKALHVDLYELFCINR